MECKKVGLGVVVIILPSVYLNAAFKLVTGKINTLAFVHTLLYFLYFVSQLLNIIFITFKYILKIVFLKLIFLIATSNIYIKLLSSTRVVPFRMAVAED